MKAQITRNNDHVIIATYYNDFSSLRGLARWVGIYVKDITLGSLAILWFLAQRDETTKGVIVGNYTVTLDGS